MAVEQDLTIFRGEKITLNFTMNPVPQGGIAGWTISLSVSRKPNSSTKLITKAGSVVDGPTGTFKVDLTSTETDIKPDTYFYDVSRVDVGAETVLSIGDFVVSPVARLPLP